METMDSESSVTKDISFSQFHQQVSEKKQNKYEPIELNMSEEIVRWNRERHVCKDTLSPRSSDIKVKVSSIVWHTAIDGGVIVWPFAAPLLLCCTWRMQSA